MESRLITARYGSVPVYKFILRAAAWLLAFAYAFKMVYGIFAMVTLPWYSRIVELLIALLILVVFIAVVELFLIIVDLLLDLEDHARRILDQQTGERSGTTPKK